MQWLLFSVIVVLSLLMVIALLILWKVFQHSYKLNTQLLSQNQTLANLATAKNLEAYAQIQTVQTTETQTSFNHSLPMDDISVAKRLMDNYEENGLDPSLALNQDDFLEFGGIDQFNGKFPGV